MLRSVTLALVCASLLAGCCTELAAPTSKSEPAVAPSQTPAEEIVQLRTLSEALSLAKPYMTEVYGETSEGTRLLVLWALDQMTWDHVGVEKDETTHAEVLKDVELERGKRLCWRGSVIQIVADRSLGDAVYTGLLYSSQGDLYHFYGVGSSGDLVEDSYGRFCGVVTGKFDYANSGGGTSHAIELVGMFDLPENKRTSRELARQPTPSSGTATSGASSSDSGEAAGTRGAPRRGGGKPKKPLRPNRGSSGNKK